MGEHRYLLSIGSNRRHHPLGAPRKVMGAASIELARHCTTIERAGPLVFSRSLGPSRRQYANSVLLVKTRLEPLELLALCKRIERQYGRRVGGQPWSSHVLDLDVILWDGGTYASIDLVIPHPRFREREFVLKPAARIAPRWRDPITGLTLRQLNARLAASRRGNFRYYFRDRISWRNGRVTEDS